MMTSILFKERLQADELAARLCTAEVGIFPVDTIYGIQALANEEGAEALYELKKRPKSKNFITLMTLEDLRKSDLIVPEELYAIWPAPLTCILADSTGKTHAVRVPTDPFLYEVLSYSGPIYSTSVNISGEPTLLTFDDISPVFDGKVNYILNTEIKEPGRPSTLVDMTKTPHVLLRQGDYDAAALLK